MNRIIKISIPDIHAEYSERAKKRYADVYRRQKEDLDGLVDFIYDYKP